MDYKLDYASWGSIFAVPCAVVDRHIRLCSGLSLKVLLWLLRNPSKARIRTLWPSSWDIPPRISRML